MRSIEENRDVVVGVKVRLDRNITDNGRTEHAVYQRALSAAKKAGVPLMVHHTNSGVPLSSSPTEVLSCPGSLRPGDIYTHTLHGHESSIMDRATGKLDPVVFK